MAQSAAAPSPFTPIADYAFLSNCHTGALIAPDGAIDWLCVPRFDSPSVFGSLLDRQAGFFRFGPFGINHPSARAYEPGTNVLETTWKTPAGWIVVRDALDDGTRGPRRPGHAAHPAARRRRRRAHARADRRVHRRPRRGRARVRAGCSTTAARPAPGRWSTAAIGAADAPATGSRRMRLQSDLALGIEGSRVAGPAHARSRRHGLLRAVVGRGARRAGRRRRRRRAHPAHDSLLAYLAQPGPDPRPPRGATRSSARRSRSRASPTCRPARRSPRSRRRCPRRRAASATGTTATRGCATRRSRCRRCTSCARLGSRRVHAVHRRHRGDRGRLAADHVRHRRPPRPHRVDPRRAVGVRRRTPGSHRQRRVQPAAERRVRLGARLDPAPHPARAAAAPPAVADRRDRRPSARPRCGASPTRGSGRRAARRSTTCRRS